MIKHVILWKLKDMTDAEKAKVKADAKAALEALDGKIEGLISIKVNTVALPTSNCDMMLDSAFESTEALATYQKHPLHQAAANSFVRPFADVRLCLDYEA